MKYIAVFILVCLFFTIRADDDSDRDNDGYTNSVEDTMCRIITTKKECQNMPEVEGVKCCWAEGRDDGRKKQKCMAVETADFDYYFDEVKDDLDKASLDCSGKYLYVASLLLLFFVF